MMIDFVCFMMAVLCFCTSLAQRENVRCLGIREFTLVDELARFSVAKEQCVERGKFLGGITNEEENSFLLALAEDFFINEANIWIGETA